MKRYAEHGFLNKLMKRFTVHPTIRMELLDQNRAKIDQDTSFETLAIGLAVISSVLTVVLIGILCTSYIKMSLATAATALSLLVSLSAAGWYLFWNMDIYYIIDREKQQLLLYRKIFSMESSRPLQRFDEMNLVTVDSEHVSAKRSSYYRYSTIILLNNGRKIRISDWITDFHQCNSKTQALAEFMGITFVEGQPNRIMKITPGNRYGEMTVEHKTMFQHIFCEPAHIIGMVIVVLLFLLVLFLRCKG